MQTERQRYYCYSCEQSFQDNTLANKCVKCQSQAIEGVDSNEAPSEVYNIQQNSNVNSGNNFNTNSTNSNQSQNSQPQMNPQNNAFGSAQFFHFQTRVIPQQPNQQVFQFNMNIAPPNLNEVHQLNHILLNGGLQQYLNDMMGEPHLTPANSQQINSLQKIEVVKECLICQEENLEDKKGYKLKCGHDFHVECITPWFHRMNTCPACRKQI